MVFLLADWSLAAGVCCRFCPFTVCGLFTFTILGLYIMFVIKRAQSHRERPGHTPMPTMYTKSTHARPPKKTPFKVIILWEHIHRPNIKWISNIWVLLYSHLHSEIYSTDSIVINFFSGIRHNSPTLGCYRCYCCCCCCRRHLSYFLCGPLLCVNIFLEHSLCLHQGR